jgi:hypothetical protein
MTRNRNPRRIPIPGAYQGNVEKAETSKLVKPTKYGPTFEKSLSLKFNINDKHQNAKKFALIAKSRKAANKLEET